MHPYPFPFRSPLLGSGQAALNGASPPKTPAPSDGGRGSTPSTPWSDLEAALAGPQSAALAQSLQSSLEDQRQNLSQKIQSLSMDRSAYALTQAYLDAIEAAQEFLAANPICR